jgi:hypothetical protein
MPGRRGLFIIHPLFTHHNHSQHTCQAKPRISTRVYILVASI